MNYKHLQYFWAVTQTGTIAEAARRLDLTPQTISVQIADLERDLGRVLFDRKGGRLELTEDGRIARAFADDIFALGNEMREVLGVQRNRSRNRIRVGAASTIPKMVLFDLLGPLLRQDEPPRLNCQEGRAERLLEDLVSNRLDLLFLDRPLGHEPGRVSARHLGESDAALLVAADIAEPLIGKSLLHILDAVPLLLPCRGNPMRDGVDIWLREQRHVVSIALESDDSALLKTFARNGLGLVFVPGVVSRDTQRCYRLVEVARTDLFRERFRVIARAGAHLESELELISTAALKLFPPNQ